MIMEQSEIKELIKAFDESSSVFLELEREGFRLKLKKETADRKAAIIPQPVKELPTKSQSKEDRMTAEGEETVPSENADNEAAEDGEVVKAPLVGVFYAAPSPEDPAFVQVGDPVKKGQTLCLIEAMKMMNELKSPRDGMIKKIYVKNQDVVGFEDPLFLIGEA